jgi:hypothetical protein
MATKHTIRRKSGKLKDVQLTRSLAIKAMCTECLGFETHPKDCTSVNCPIYPFRGKTTIAFK